MKQDLNAITDAELEILQVLWKQKSATVKDVYEALNSERGTGYTTFLKQMQVMLEKGLLKRQEGSRQHVYAPVPTLKNVQRSFMDKLMQRAFGGSAGELVLQALSRYRTSPEELEEIAEMIDKVKNAQK